MKIESDYTVSLEIDLSLNVSTFSITALSGADAGKKTLKIIAKDNVSAENAENLILETVNRINEELEL